MTSKSRYVQIREDINLVRTISDVDATLELPDIQEWLGGEANVTIFFR